MSNSKLLTIKSVVKEELRYINTLVKEELDVVDLANTLV